jgi:predicted ATPase/DNA-binding winged helix-turn-helix (wHTH) protein
MADDSQSTLRFPPFHIPAGVDVVYRGDEVVPLEPRAVRVLRYLAERGDRVVPKEELLDNVWPDVFTTDAVLKTAVLKIRRALGEGKGGARWIETHHRRGYRFLGDVTREAGEAPAAPPPTNLPHPTTRVFGRERDVAAVREGLAVSRLVTLTGPGGIGKTRLALEAASGLVPDFPAGVWVVELASVADPSGVPHAVAAALGVREGADAVGSLRAWLADRRLLVVLDNCEHVVEAAAALVADLLRAGGGLRVLATSREALAVPGEAVRAVQPLAEADAVGLFLDRARLRNPDFERSRDDSKAIAEVCVGLDGIPLALELAAARARVLSAAQIAARLGDRLRLLAPAGRATPSRHRTLRDAVDWSHDLLPEEERALFRRLSVFAGGWTLEAAEAVCREPEVLDLLDRLVDKSLVTAEGQNGDARYRMLETIRQYAAEKLCEAGEDVALRARHLAWFATLMTRLFESARDAISGERLRTSVADYDNLRAAMGYGFGPGGDAEAATRIAVVLGLFWQLRGHWSEGRRWLELALAAGPAVSPPVRAGALLWAGALAHDQGDLERARSLLEESLALRREEGHVDRIGGAIHILANVLERMGRADAAVAYREEFFSLMRESGNARGIASAATGLGLNALGRGDYERAAVWFAEALAGVESTGNPANVAVALHNLGDVALHRGDLEGAMELLERSIAAARDAGALRVVAHSTHALGYAAVELGRYDEATARLLEALEIDEEEGDREGMAFVLEGLARAAAARGDAARSMRLAGAAHALRESIGAPVPSFEGEVLARDIAAARGALGDAAADEAFREGRAMALERAVAFAREPG